MPGHVASAPPRLRIGVPLLACKQCSPNETQHYCGRSNSRRLVHRDTLQIEGDVLVANIVRQVRDDGPQTLRGSQVG